MKRRADWRWIAHELARLPRGHVLCVRRELVEHPALLGAQKSVGLPLGQVADWRFPPDARGGGVHVREYAREWRAHMDRVHPDRSLIGHFFADVLAS